MEQSFFPVSLFGLQTSLSFSCSTALILPAAKLEAWGIEPQSRDNVRGGLYMLRRFFDLNTGDENRHPSPMSSRL